MINWIKRWKFLVLIVIIGVLYLSFVDRWQVYAQTLQRVAEWCDAGNDLLGLGQAHVSGGDAFEAENDDVFYSGAEGVPVGETMANEGTVESADGTVSDGDGGGNSAPEFTNVGDDYFVDAVFIGDSRTVGMFEYGGLENTAQFYASTGLTVFRLFQEDDWKDSGVNSRQTLEEVLSEQSFSKIYLMVGINEMGTGTVEKFAQAYGEAVARLQELQPDAIIYLQSVIKVTEERSQLGDYITNEGIEERNAEIAKLADGQKVFFLDVNAVVCDESGGMIADYTYDGVHLKAIYIPLWKEYLKSHAIICQ